MPPSVKRTSSRVLATLSIFINLSALWFLVIESYWETFDNIQILTNFQKIF
jgi:hypothetical protein